MQRLEGEERERCRGGREREGKRGVERRGVEEGGGGGVAEGGCSSRREKEKKRGGKGEGLRAAGALSHARSSSRWILCTQNQKTGFSRMSRGPQGNL